MAAVNDITAREEQFQSYLTQNKSEMNKNDYFSKLNSNETMNIDCMTKSIIENPLMTVSIATSERNDLFMNSCDSPINEFVDINEMEFIQKKNDEGKRDKNLILRRSHRKKTTKRKDEECNLFLLNFTYDIQIFHKF